MPHTVADVPVLTHGGALSHIILDRGPELVQRRAAIGQTVPSEGIEAFEQGRHFLKGGQRGLTFPGCGKTAGDANTGLHTMAVSKVGLTITGNHRQADLTGEKVDYRELRSFGMK